MEARVVGGYRGDGDESRPPRQAAARGAKTEALTAARHVDLATLQPSINRLANAK